MRRHQAMTPHSKDSIHGILAIQERKHGLEDVNRFLHPSGGSIDLSEIRIELRMVVSYPQGRETRSCSELYRFHSSSLMSLSILASRRRKRTKMVRLSTISLQIVSFAIARQNSVWACSSCGFDMG